MQNLSKIDESWVPLQAKVFSRWVSSHLRQSDTCDVKVENIETDLTNGVALVELAQILTKTKAPRQWDRHPKLNVKQVENCNLAVEMFKNDGLKLINISGKDLNDKNLKLTLGFIWSLILHYSIGTAFDNSFDSSNKNASSKGGNKKAQTPTDALLSWATDRIANYSNVSNFQPYGLAMCALIDSIDPALINFASLKPTENEKNLKIATDAMKKLGIAAFVLPEDIANNHSVDEKTLLTQLSTVKKAYENPVPKIEERAVDLELETEEEEVEQSDNNANSNANNNNANNNDNDNGHTAVKGAPLTGSNNASNEGRRFRLTMTLSGKDYQNGQKIDENKQTGSSGPNQTLNLTHVPLGGKGYLNPAGAKLDLARPNPSDVNQQFTFGHNYWTTVIDSYARPGMVWDVADADRMDPPEGTPFYLFPFHGRHNQHFVYKDEHIYSTQNGQVVTYVGGEYPFVMKVPSEKLRARQTFHIQLL